VLDGVIVHCNHDDEAVSVVSQCKRCGWEFCDDHVEEADHDCANVKNKSGFTPTRGPLAGQRTPSKPTRKAKDDHDREAASSSSSSSSSDSDNSSRDADDSDSADDDENAEAKRNATSAEKTKNPIRLAADEAARRL
jgi:hypothetical protein